VFEQAGYIHELDPKSGREHIVNITATGDFPWMMARWEDVSNRLTNMAPSPTGKRVAVESRGEIFTIPAEKGDVRNLTNSSSSAERDPAWSPDGKFISYFSDKSGEYRLYIEAQDGLTPPREIVLEHPTHYYTPSWSPDSKKLVFTDTGLQVWVLDVASGKARVVGNDPWMVPQRTLNPVWSPNSKWVAYSSRLRSLYHAIFVSNAETGETKQVTDGLADAVWPAWDASGKYLWFLASTDFGLRSQWLDMTSYDHDENFGLYLAVLKKTDSSPLLPESDEDRGVGTGRRTIPGQCIGDTPAGTGAGGGGFGGGAANELIRYRLCNRQAATFVNGVTAFEVSADGRKLVYRSAGGGGGGRGAGAGAAGPPTPSLFIVDADRTPPQPGSGRVNFTLRMYLDPKEEFKQIFNEGWRNQRDYLHVPNLH